MEVKVANPPLPLKVRRTQLRRTFFFLHSSEATSSVLAMVIVFRRSIYA